MLVFVMYGKIEFWVSYIPQYPIKICLVIKCRFSFYPLNTRKYFVITSGEVKYFIGLHLCIEYETEIKHRNIQSFNTNTPHSYSCGKPMHDYYIEFLVLLLVFKQIYYTVCITILQGWPSSILGKYSDNDDMVWEMLCAQTLITVTIVFKTQLLQGVFI